MGSFTAELQLGNQRYPVTHYHYAFSQSTSERGRVSAKVRQGHLELQLAVPHDEQLLAWAADPHKALQGALVTLDDVGRAREHVAFAAGYCVLYNEFFRSGDSANGAYQCTLHIAAPAGFTLNLGAPGGSFVAPAAREHGKPQVVSSSKTLAMAGDTPGDISTCPPDVTARLQAQVTLACKTQKSKCTGENTCAELLARIPAAMACIAARESIMIQCYGGGDKVHKDEVAKRKDALEKCRELYQKKCGPLPQPEPVPQPVPSRQQDTDPPHKVNPAVPVGLTGAALLLYYLWEVVEGALIIL